MTERQNNMKFRVYNQNGKVKVTKICLDGAERPMFSEVADGEMVEIEVDSTITTKSHKYKADKQDALNVSLELAARMLAFSMASRFKSETMLACDVLRAAEAGTVPDRYEDRVRDIMSCKHDGESLFKNAVEYLRFAKEKNVINEDVYETAADVLTTEEARFSNVNPFDSIIEHLERMTDEVYKIAASMLRSYTRQTQFSYEANVTYRNMVRFIAKAKSISADEVFREVVAHINSLVKKGIVNRPAADGAIEILTRNATLAADAVLAAEENV